MVELLVLLGRDLLLRPRPQRRGGIDGFALAFGVENDGKRDMIRIGLDDAAQTGRFEEFLGVLAQMQGDGGAARDLTLGRRHGERARQQSLAIVGDEHPLDVKLDPRRAFGLEQIEGRGRRHEQQIGVFDLSLDPIVNHQPRLVEHVADVMVELLVLLGRDLLLRPRPQRRGGIDGFALAFGVENDGKRDMIRIGLDDAAQTGRFEEFLGVLAEMQGDGGVVAAGLKARTADWCIRSFPRPDCESPATARRTRGRRDGRTPCTARA